MILCVLLTFFQLPESPGYVDALNSIVSQAQEVLLDFVGKNPESWAPIVSAWAIELLGQISSEYSQHCMRSNASLQDMFQVCAFGISILHANIGHIGNIGFRIAN